MRFQAICKSCRDEFLTAVYHLAQGNLSFFSSSNTSDNDVFVDDVAIEEIERIDSQLSETESKVGELARRLSAAYYMSTYSPHLHRNGSRTVLYSFPWVIASDVIYSCLS